jgi:uncharacterized glyoxalase superfamily protein PhnB
MQAHDIRKTREAAAGLVPMLAYDDAPAAIDFLTKAFGFEELFRYEMPDGLIGHAELGWESVRVMLASTFPAMGFQSPLSANGCYCQLLVYVDDVDAHYERARDAGATITAPPADQDHGGRMYRASDLEGHRWLFTTRADE